MKAVAQQGRTTVHNNLGGNVLEEGSFSIAVNGKSFGILVSSLYSDKIKAPIRELISNAFDSHAEAGCSDRPFDVHLPSRIAPTFFVRDYGTSITHENIMGLYTTLFQSTREDTNDAVGKLGLGSKSPFAYTSSFIVEAFLDGEHRTYNAYTDDDGIPKIMLLSKVPTIEERGLKVSFPVQASDLYRFDAVAQELVIGFDVMPNGIDYTPPTPTLSGGSWRMYQGEERYSYGLNQAFYVRQGCVMYPVSFNEVGILHEEIDFSPNYVSFIVDIPVGSAEPAPSREVLSYDTLTKAFVKAAVFEANNEAADIIRKKFQDAKNFLEATRMFLEYGDTLKVKNIAHGKIYSKYHEGVIDNPINGYISLADLDCFNFDNYIFRYDKVEEVKFIISRQNKSVPRRKLRIKKAMSSSENYRSSFKYRVLEEPTSKDLERIIRRLEIQNPKEKFVYDFDLPDPGPRTLPKAATIPGQAKELSMRGIYDLYWDGIKKETAERDSEALWIAVEGSNLSSRCIDHGSNRMVSIERICHHLSGIRMFAGGNVSVYGVSKSRVKDFDQAFHLREVIKSRLETFDAAPLRMSNLWNEETHRSHYGGRGSWDLFREIFGYEHTNTAGYGYNGHSLQEMKRVAILFGLEDLVEDEPKLSEVEAMKNVKKKYPLLFSATAEDYLNYVKAIKEKG